jgi:hypothetical protein
VTEHLLTLYNTKKQSRRENEQVGIVLKQDAKSLLNDFTIVDTKTNTFDENWKPVWER